MMSLNLTLSALRTGRTHASDGPSARPITANFPITPDTLGAGQLSELNVAAEMATRDVPELLREISGILEQFGKLLAELFAADGKADESNKRTAQVVFTGLVRPAMTSFLRALERELS